MTLKNLESRILNTQCEYLRLHGSYKDLSAQGKTYVWDTMQWLYYTEQKLVDTGKSTQLEGQIIF